MVSLDDIKFFKSSNNGLGGGIDSSTQIISGDPNNLFPLVTQPEQDTGTTRYLLAYVKNTGSESVKQFTFWTHQGTPIIKTTMQWAKGIAGKNGDEQNIPNITTAPTGLTWINTNEKIVITDELKHNDRYGIWFKNEIGEDVRQARGDEAVFKYRMTIPSGGTGTPSEPSGGGTGGTGGNPPTVTNWKIAVVGDIGTESASEKVLDMCADYNYVIMPGDLSYNDENAFFDLMDDNNLKSKTLAAFGNHEEDDGYSSYKSYFGYSKAYNMRKFQNVGMISIDSNVNNDDGSSQHEQVEDWLEELSKDGNIDWIFCTMHHPWFGANSEHGYNNNDIVEAYHSLFMQYKVAFVLTAHNHNWQRTHKVAYDSGDPTSPNVVDSASPYTNDENGLIHVVSGAGGHDSGSSLYSLGSQPSFQAYQQTKSNNGVFEIVASNNGQTLTGRFRAIDGDTFGQFTYTK